MKNTATGKVLIIDDEPGILRMLAFALSRKGYMSDTAQTGAEGIQKFLSNTYDLVLTDIKMPGMSGDEVLHQLRKTNNAIPVVGMSGTPWLLDDHLFDAVLEKPCSMKKVYTVIEKFLPPPPVY
ncbi:MAG: response regulator [Desulfotignum sp.]